MPGSEPTLHVKGDVTCPTTGYCARLTPHQPQGINPAIYLFDLTVTPPAPGQIVGQMVTDVLVHFQEVTRNHYEKVTILPENITVEVRLVS